MRKEQERNRLLEAKVDGLNSSLSQNLTSLQDFERLERACAVIAAALKAATEAVARLQKKSKPSPDHDFGPGF